ncbi:MAG: Rieske 2Fe-2S domain-containing protein [Meiothermus sp.]|uniref:QcrA and Rieske domain-containing protein n=1 Tax=Meiothermus sp. TaxID=1955249 RepID=UPI0025D76F79|nr:Rieske 2Fe-2S domain-containing protein [Meiothermus sp.]MCS7057618.1 Rieske 2Fe-2S domain-containing protein [Meiothermus sp.]MCS7193970.1 Rieske 2Fe-2S domain-containing protein [Meiothermus sp.]MCX7740377.1 Rieske 2Fe-2S domain-containing protein [Meiothermus sp.]MDW8090744.1 Rieske 2Fe-2S domain-containing protein [Meiothermus sp.]MDW8480830.1 Rieske 2Fe-2S domain-containing protein [Meiothermus sp.]
MNRRDAHKALIAGAIGLAMGVPSRAQPRPVRVVELGRLAQVGAEAEFTFAGERAFLLRVAPPETPSPRVQRLGDVYLVAYSRTCTHAGCTVPLPDQRGIIECGCHGSRFRSDGTLLQGPASTDLRAIRLELRDGLVWAVGWLDAP